RTVACRSSTPEGSSSPSGRRAARPTAWSWHATDCSWPTGGPAGWRCSTSKANRSDAGAKRGRDRGSSTCLICAASVAEETFTSPRSTAAACRSSRRNASERSEPEALTHRITIDGLIHLFSPLPERLLLAFAQRDGDAELFEVLRQRLAPEVEL